MAHKDNILKHFIEFDSEIFLEYSITPNVTPLGMAKNRMELWLYPELDGGYIIWDFELDDEGEDEVVIGLEIEGNNIVGYDGVMGISSYAIQLLNEAGFNTDEIE